MPSKLPYFRQFTAIVAKLVTKSRSLIIFGVTETREYQTIRDWVGLPSKNHLNSPQKISRRKRNHRQALILFNGPFVTLTRISSIPIFSYVPRSSRFPEAMITLNKSMSERRWLRFRCYYVKRSTSECWTAISTCLFATTSREKLVYRVELITVWVFPNIKRAGSIANPILSLCTRVQLRFANCEDSEWGTPWGTWDSFINTRIKFGQFSCTILP